MERREIMRRLSFKKSLWGDIDEQEQNKMKGEVLMGLAKIRCSSLYDQPSHKIPDNHARKYGLCRHCEHFQCAASESKIKVAICKEIKVRLTSSEPVTECSWYIDERVKVDCSDLLHIATFIDTETEKKAGII
jgi:hypothetical protein